MTSPKPEEPLPLMERLRNAAEKATPGPFIYKKHPQHDHLKWGALVEILAPADEWNEIYQVLRRTMDQAMADAEYIVLADPKNIIAVLDELAHHKARADESERSLVASEESRKFWFNAADEQNKRADALAAQVAVLVEAGNVIHDTLVGGQMAGGLDLVRLSDACNKWCEIVAELTKPQDSKRDVDTGE